ncbi:HupE/UreJ family protein [Parerythrobacter jejuensis]|uniref:HupE/UreJ family protein n=1 Tax=Parerythrobacter jejuensis TaxID=795812 RepID=A0A845AWZ9_9SPHN|nr:HupE/UreJ family protein [Parerythrobacter jejuensis]MXP30541.1 HupE/UreJ family protein [Parerythrobacter jejuensis]MXP33301.1 HupE/UreJ family protein [Parerythrobacter jejuensis]
MIARLLAITTLVSATLVGAVPAWADELRPGFVEFAEIAADQWQLNWKQPLPAPGPAELAVPILPEACTILGEPVARSAPLALIGSATVQCSGPVAGGQIGFEAIFGGGDVLLRVAPLEDPVQTFRLTENAPIATIIAEPTGWEVWRSYFVLGIEHILEGWDHLLFVIALVLLVRRGWDVAKAVTAFTVAHSLTLAGVTLGLVGLPGRPVEAVIALSIVLLAVEGLRRDSMTWTRRWPWLVAFLFGLIHGFGFAGALNEIGLPEGDVPAALISFNLGVEAGQLAVVALVLLAIAALRLIQPARLEPVIRIASYAIGITGTYWLIDRLVG